MRKLFNKPWFVGLLAVTAVVFVTYSLWPARVSREAGADVDPTGASVTDLATASTIPVGPHLSLRDALKQLTISGSVRDPFTYHRPAPATANQEKIVEPDLTDSITVSAVWVQADITYVLLNGHIYKIGDQIGRLTLESANHDGVWLRHWKGRDFVAVGRAFTLTTSARQAAEISRPRES